MDDGVLTERLHHLAEEIVGPLLEEIRPGEWDSPRTLDLPEVDKVMNQVIRELDQSELVIADVSLARPSVYYELAIRHCLGRPYVMVRQKGSRKSTDERIAFDVADYRYIPSWISLQLQQRGRAPHYAPS